MLLGPDDPLPGRPRRVAVVGVSGSGKTTLAARIGQVAGLPHVEIDALFHGPGWVPRAEFLDDVRRLVAREPWVTEFQYDAARPLIAPRLDLLVWLDLPTWRTLAQVVTRTARRRLRREQLWNGNQEGPLWRALVDRDHIVRWSWRPRRGWRELPERVAGLGAPPDLPVVRLRSHRESRRWLAGPLSSVVQEPLRPPGSSAA